MVNIAIIYKLHEQRLFTKVIKNAKLDGLGVRQRVKIDKGAEQSE
jgi:hypothetical protein